MVNVSDKIIDCLEADGQANEAVRYPEFGPGFWLQALVRCRRGMRDQALGVAEIVRQLDDREPIQEPERSLLAAGQPVQPSSRRISPSLPA